MRFRPCIDLHNGKVKQIVGSTLRDNDPLSLRTNFSSEHPSSHYAHMYRDDQLPGGHVIMLGPGNDRAAEEALRAWPGGLQIGGGITDRNAASWLDKGASHVIVTSHVFHDGMLDQNRLARLCAHIGKERLVLDLSCRRRDHDYFVVTDRWQKFTDLRITADTLKFLAGFCDEFLVHAVDVEGQCMGVDTKLIEILATQAELPITYAGGVSSMADLEVINKVGQGRIDATVGSALDIFGGKALTYSEVVAFHQRQQEHANTTD